MSEGRKAISKRTRFEVFKRDGFKCLYCGQTPPDVVLHVDHIIAVANGGENHIGNYATSCSDCNLGKSDVPLETVPKGIDKEAEIAAERVEQMQGFAQAVQEAFDAEEALCWDVAEALQEGASEGYSTANFRSIKMFVKRLGAGGTLDSAHAASDKYYEGHRRFKYFCGICWRKIREREE